MAHLFHAFAADEMWNFKHNLDTSIVLPWHFGRAQACFPDWLLGRPRAAYRSLSPPVLFAFVKSKCFHDDGIKKCQKPNHSCLRRILDMAEIPYSRAWKLAARAVRGVVQATGCTREVFSMEAAVPMLTSGVQRLAPPWRYGEKCPETTPVSSCIGQCRCCGKAINGLAVFSADIDQAFEACRAERVTPAWSRLTRRYQDKTGCSAIYVQKGTKFVYRIPTEAAWSRSWWVFTLALLAGILQAATLFNIITFTDKVVELLGLSIGGVMSAAAVSVCLGDEEARVVLQESQVPGFPHFESSDELLRSIFWLRYVDDLLAISRQFCSSCLERFFRNVYCEPLSVVFSSDGVARPAMFEWLDLEIHLYTTSLSWTQKNPNRSWVLDGGAQLKSSIMPWMGISPISFFKVRGLLMGRIARGFSQHLSHALLYFVIMEFLLELNKQGYPLTYIKSVIHSVAPFPPVIWARRAIRSLLHHDTAMGKWQIKGDAGSGHKSGKWNGGQAGADAEAYKWPWKFPPPPPAADAKKKKKKRRPSSSSSSSSASSDTGKVLAAAESYMMKHSKRYRTYVKDRQNQEREKEYERQGKIIAQAIRPELAATLAASGVAPAGGAPAGAPSGSVLPPAAGAAAWAPPAAGPSSAGAAEAAGSVLTKLQMALIMAECGNTIKLTSGTEDELVRAIEGKWSQNPKIVKAVDAMIKTYGEDRAVPRPKKDRIKVLFDVVRKLT